MSWSVRSGVSSVGAGGSESEPDSGADENAEEVDEAQMRVIQLQRNARSKGRSKLMHRFKGIGEDEMAGIRARFQRISASIRLLLRLHHPVELSSICGNLKLPVQDKGPVSLEHIVKYCIIDGKFSDERLMDVVSNCWEGALYEFLKAVGYSVYSATVDPKMTTMKVLRCGLYDDGLEPFVPHYIRRRMEDRINWPTSEDLAPKLLEIKKVEDIVKKSEKAALNSEDYSNVLRFLQKLHELRRLELEFREYATKQLESSRSSQDRAESNVQAAEEMLMDLEVRYMKVSTTLNTKLAERETASRELAASKLLMESQLQRLRRVVRSCRMSTEARCRDLTPLDPPRIEPVTVLDEADDECHLTILALQKDILDYKVSADTVDNQLRAFSQEQAQQISNLKDNINDLMDDIRVLQHKLEFANDRERRAVAEVAKVAEDIVKRENMAESTRKLTWEASVRWANRAQVMEEKLRAMIPQVRAAIVSKHLEFKALGAEINKQFALATPERVHEWLETDRMEAEEQLSVLFNNKNREQRKRIKKNVGKKVALKAAEEPAAGSVGLSPPGSAAPGSRGQSRGGPSRGSSKGTSKSKSPGGSKAGAKSKSPSASGKAKSPAPAKAPAKAPAGKTPGKPPAGAKSAKASPAKSPSKKK